MVTVPQRTRDSLEAQLPPKAGAEFAWIIVQQGALAHSNILTRCLQKPEGSTKKADLHILEKNSWQLLLLRCSVSQLSILYCTATTFQHTGGHFLFPSPQPPTKIVEVFVAWQVIANDVMGFPAPKKREAGTDLHLHRVIQDKEVAGGDVPNFISVIDVLSSSWENGLYGEKQQ